METRSNKSPGNAGTGIDPVTAGKGPTVASLLAATAARVPDATALQQPDGESLSWEELNRRVSSTAGRLRNVGLAPHDRVAIAMPGGVDLGVLLLATMSTAIAVPVNPGYRRDELDLYLSALKADALVADPKVAPHACELAAAQGIPLLGSDASGLMGDFREGMSPAPNDIALVMHTSGTTARPKIVPLTHRNLCAAAAGIAGALGLSRADRCLNVMPLYHLHGLSTLLGCVAAGTSSVCTNGFVAPSFFEWLDSYAPTWYTAVPAMHRAVVERAEANVDVISRRPLRFVRSMSSPLPDGLRGDLERIFRAPVVEAYGLTEASHSTSNRLTPAGTKPGSVGTSTGPEIAIEGSGRLLPPGERGEILVRGENVADGYEDDETATAAAFTDGWFRTGDVGYLDDDGFLYVTGRLKEIIDKGAEKVSPAEVEEVLLGHPHVVDAAAFGIPSARLGEDVGAAVVLSADAEVDELELRRFAARRLADFKVPTRVLVVDELPRSGPTGKVLRGELAARLPAVIAPKPASGPGIAPRSPLEAAVAHVFADVLRLSQVGVEDDFLALGGDSLTAGRVLASIRDNFDAEIDFVEFFDRPTVASLAQRISRSRIDGRSRPEAQLVPIAREGPLRCSYGQERLWFVHQVTAGSAAYNLSWAVRLRGSLDERSLESALQQLVRRHEAFRTTFRDIDGEPFQVICDAAEFLLRRQDVTKEPDPKSAARALVNSHAATPFDLERGPLFTAQLIRLAADDHVLDLAAHHIIADGWSRQLAFDELSALYNAVRRDEPSLLADPTLHYADYAAWQRATLTEERLARSLGYWKGVLADAPPALDLPTDRPRSSSPTFRGATRHTTISHSAVERLQTLANEEGATPFMVLLSAFGVLLSRYSLTDDLVVGTPIATRKPELERTIGFFVNALPLRIDLSGKLSFRELVSRVRQRALEAYSNHEVPFERLVAELQPDRDLSRHALFQVFFALNATPELPQLASLESELWPAETGASRVDLTLLLEQGQDGLEAVWEYAVDLFDGETVERMGRHYARLLERFLGDPELLVDEVSLLDDAERKTLLVDWNDTAVRRPDICLHELVEEQVKRTPNAVAVSFDEQQLTYRELDDQANRVAHTLARAGAGPRSHVAVCVERSLELVVGLLAILKAGCAYIPLDPSYPDERLRFMLDDSQASVILAAGQLLDLPETGVVRIDLDSVEIADELTTRPHVDVSPDDVAYVIYTSGSTGQPKGAMNTHRGIVNRLLWMQEQYGLDETDRVLQKTPFGFDVSVWEFFWPLLTGARLVVAKPGGHQDPDYLVETIAEAEVTTIHFVPSMLHAFLAAEGVERCASLRRVVCSGEALPGELVERFFERLGCELHNLYGPTEAAVDVTAWQCSPGSNRPTVLIGRPIANTQIYILDAQQQPTPVGVPGELHIGGVQVALGYVNRPELTAERFVSNPFGPGRLYRTGDLARWTASGEIEFLGRLDHQIKLRGVRIELGEVEAVLNAHEGVETSVVVPVELGVNDIRLVAYLVPNLERAAPIRRGLRLEREGRLERETCIELPNGLIVAHANPGETRFLYQEVFERRTYLRHGIALPENACVFDVGANIGLFSLLASELSAGAHIFAFEPIPQMFELLCLNAELHDVNATLFDCGLGAEEGTGEFTYFPHNTILSGRFAGSDKRRVVELLLKGEEQGVADGVVDELLEERLETKVVVRPLRTLSSVIAEHGVDRIDLLKIDVEKSEWEVLGGLADTDWDKVGQIFVEVHERNGLLERIAALLEHRGFSVAVEKDESLPGRGLFHVFAVRRTLVPSVRKALRSWRNERDLVADVNKLLRKQLPEAMVPAAFVVIESLPLTTNGKLDRGALPPPHDLHPELAAERAAPRTPIEAALAEIWSQMLGVERVGVDDSFFELGGHSILLAQTAARVRDRFGIGLPLRSIFETPTVAGVAAKLEQELRGEPRVESDRRDAPLSRRPTVGRYALSLSQRGLWLIDRLEPGSSRYNVALPFRSRGPLDVAALQQALDDLVERHEVLRTRFVLDGEEPVCRVQRGVDVELTTTDLRDVPPAAREAQATQVLREAAERPFDLTRDVLLRATLVHVASNEHMLLLETHHIAFDGWSARVLLHDLGELYAARSMGRQARLAEPSLQYSDFAAWQQEQLAGARLDEEVSWWRQQLAGAPSLVDLAAGRTRSSGSSSEAGLFSFELPRSAAESVMALCREDEVTPYILLLSVFATLIYRLTGQDDLLVSSPMANRPRLELETLIGYVSTTVVLRLRLAGNPCFRELLARVRETTLDAHAHQEVPFEKVVEAVRPQRVPGLNPLAQINFRTNVGELPVLQLLGTETSPLRIDISRSRFDLALEVHVRDDGMRLAFNYNKDLFDLESLQALAHGFADLLDQINGNPEIQLLSFDLPLNWSQRSQPDSRARIERFGARRRARDGARRAN